MTKIHSVLSLASLSLSLKYITKRMNEAMNKEMKDMMMCSVGETWWALHKWPLVTWLSHRMMVNKMISITQNLHMNSQHALPT